MNAHDPRARGARTTRVFLQINPELVRQLAAVVEAGIALLDEIGGDDDLEADGDEEDHAWPEGCKRVSGPPDEDAEEGGDEEPSLGAVEVHPTPPLGWPCRTREASQAKWGYSGREDLEDDHDGREPECEDEGAQVDDEGFDDKEGDLTAPNTSAGLDAATRLPQTGKRALRMREAFDPRLGRRTGPTWKPERLCDFRQARPPTFPHEPEDRRPFSLWQEKERIGRSLRPLTDRLG